MDHIIHRTLVEIPSPISFCIIESIRDMSLWTSAAESVQVLVTHNIEDAK